MQNNNAAVNNVLIAIPDSGRPALVGEGIFTGAAGIASVGVSIGPASYTLCRCVNCCTDCCCCGYTLGIVGSALVAGFITAGILGGSLFVLAGLVIFICPYSAGSCWRLGYNDELRTLNNTYPMVMLFTQGVKTVVSITLSLCLVACTLNALIPIVDYYSDVSTAGNIGLLCAAGVSVFGASLLIFWWMTELMLRGTIVSLINTIQEMTAARRAHHRPAIVSEIFKLCVTLSSVILFAVNAGQSSIVTDLDGYAKTAAYIFIAPLSFFVSSITYEIVHRLNNCFVSVSASLRDSWNSSTAFFGRNNNVVPPAEQVQQQDVAIELEALPVDPHVNDPAVDLHVNDLALDPDVNGPAVDLHVNDLAVDPDVNGPAVDLHVNDLALAPDDLAVVVRVNDLAIDLDVNDPAVESHARRPGYAAGIMGR